MKKSILLTVIVFAALIACPELVSGSAHAKDNADAGALYLKWCSQCHGLTGRGDGVNSTPDMTINPRDHTDPSFMSTRTDEQFEEVIRDGGSGIAKSPLMPMWKKTLTQEEIKALVGYLRELCKCEYIGVISHKKLRKVDVLFR